MFAEPANTLCLSSCKQHDAFQAAAVIVAAAEADEREAKEAQEAEEEAEEVDSREELEEGSEEESEAQDEGCTGSAARPKRQRNQWDRFDPGHEGSRPQRATTKKPATRNAAGYRDNDVDALFRGEVEKFTSSLTTELARQ